MEKTTSKDILKEFVLMVDEKQLKRLNQFSKHKCQYYYNPGTIGGCITYKFIPTSLGTVIQATCLCGKEIDVTDYQSW